MAQEHFSNKATRLPLFNDNAFNSAGLSVILLIRTAGSDLKLNLIQSRLSGWHRKGTEKLFFCLLCHKNARMV